MPNISLYLEDDKAIKEVDKKVHIAFVLCGGGHRLDEAEVLVKSAALHTETDLHFSIFTDQRNHTVFCSILQCTKADLANDAN